MTLFADENESSIRQHLERLTADWRAGATAFPRSMGFQAGNVEGEVHWRPDLDVWGHFGESYNRYWYVFGTQAPAVARGLNIACEVNVPFDGINRRCAGVVARDGAKTLLLSTGKLGGGKPGVGKSTFWRFAEGRLPIRQVSWSDGKTWPCFVVCEIGSPKANEELARYVNVAGAFKEACS